MKVSLPFESLRLENGLRVFLHEHHAVPLVAINIWYRVGSRDEHVGRTGLAHLLEHLMFEGSEHVPPGMFDRRLEDVGGTNNGSTSADRTNYWITVPAHAAELALFLDSDRMGWLLPALTRERFEAQRSVVINERRQSYENRPYGLAWERIHAALYPQPHPYQWPVIGWLDDLRAITFDDVRDFFAVHYAPANATLAVAGAFDGDRMRDRIESHFGAVPAGPAPVRAHAALIPQAAERMFSIDDAVYLPRLYLTWATPPSFAEHDAELDLAAHVIAAGRASRLYRSLVYERQIAQDVDAFQDGGQLASTFSIVVTARSNVSLDEIERSVRDEIVAIARDGVRDDELEAARNVVATAFVDGLRTVGGFGGRADLLNLYALLTGDAGSLSRDWERYRTATRESVAQAVRRHLLDRPPLTLSVLPRGGTGV